MRRKALHSPNEVPQIPGGGFGGSLEIVVCYRQSFFDWQVPSSKLLRKVGNYEHFGSATTGCKEWRFTRGLDRSIETKRAFSFCKKRRRVAFASYHVMTIQLGSPC